MPFGSGAAGRPIYRSPFGETHMIRVLRRLLPAFALLALLVPCARAQEFDLTVLIHDTEKMTNDPNEVLLVWWLPTEFWEVSMQADPNVTPQQVAEVREVVQDYVLVAVADGTMGPFGGVQFRAEPDVRAKLSIADEAGNNYRPIAPQQL